MVSIVVDVVVDGDWTKSVALSVVDDVELVCATGLGVGGGVGDGVGSGVGAFVVGHPSGSESQAASSPIQLQQSPSNGLAARQNAILAMSPSGNDGS